MKKRLASCIIFLVTIFSIHAQEMPTYEIGVMIGEPTGLSGKLWLNEMNALDVGAAWSFSDDGMLALFADYLFHPLIIPFQNGSAPIYIGLGPSLRLGDENFIAGRVPIGVSYILDEAPISFFGEIAPVIEIIPDTQFHFNGGIGIRLAF